MGGSSRIWLLEDQRGYMIGFEVKLHSPKPFQVELV